MKKKIFCLWITGLSGSGKTTLANNTKNHLSPMGYNIVLLDGDDVRSSVNTDLSFTMESRDENVRRIAQLTKLLSKQNIVTIVSVISPMENQRILARKIFGDNFHLIYLKASIDRCLLADSKGLYKKATDNNISNFTGMTSPYEEPKEADLVIDTDKYNADETARNLINYIKKVVKFN